MKPLFLKLSSALFRWSVSIGSGIWTGLNTRIVQLDQPQIVDASGEPRLLTAEEKHTEADAWLRANMEPAYLPEPVRRRIIQAAVLFRRISSFL